MIDRASTWFVRVFTAGILCLSLAGAASAAQSLFRNDTTIVNPAIDATAVLNNGSLTISTFSGFPYQPVNTLYFTNSASGTFFADIGLRFETVTNNVRQPASNFVNEGSIVVGNTNSFFSFSSFSSGGSLVVLADNIVNPGTVTAGAGGLIRFQGKTLDLTRATLVISGQGSVGFAGVSNYYNPSGVKDVYWAASSNQVLAVRPVPLDLTRADSIFRPPSVSSPYHEVAGPGVSSVSPLGILPYSSAGFTAYCWTNRISSTNLVFQVVLLGTNLFDTNITSAVRFSGLGRRTTPIVEFSLADIDALTGNALTNYLYFSDSSINETNALLSANLVDPTFRPHAYELGRAAPFGWYFAGPTNQNIANISFLPFGASNSVVSNYYAAYAAEIGTPPVSLLASVNSGNPALTDPVNLPGRVELIGDQLDLTMARVRAENTIIIQTSNLTSQVGAIFDSPVINYAVASAGSTIALTNFIPSSVKRFNGQLFAYTAAWTNTVSGIGLEYQVLILDAGQLNGSQAVSLPSLNIRGANVIVENILNAGKSFVIDSPSLTFNATNQLFLISTNVPSLVASNFPSLMFFTNLGAITVASEGRFGSDRPQPLSVMVNRGNISGNTHGIRATAFENSGSIVAQAGPLTVNSSAAKLEGVTNRGALIASGNLTLSGDNFKIRNHTLTTFATLNIAVTNLLTDNGADASNQFNAFLGFNLLTRPRSGDLLGTAIATTAPANRFVTHVWAGENRGARRAGFSNNAALGRLTLAVSNNAVLNFKGVGTNNNALYVDYLELTGPLLTNLAALVTINTNFTLYFANANQPVETLDGQLGGRLRWVRNFAGPSSGVDVILLNGQSFRVNNALLNSTTIDSDGDGIVNAYDLSPFDGVVIQSSVTFINLPPLTAQITFEAAAQTDYQIEYATTISPPDWQVLLIFTNNATTNGPQTVRDPLPANEQRFYRVRYEP